MKKQFWKTDGFLGLAVALFFLLATATHLLRGLEQGAYDLGVRFSTARPANDNVVVIGIDDASLQQLGGWPWSRDVIADTVQQVAAGAPAVIGLTLPLDTPQNERALNYLHQLRQALDERRAGAEFSRVLHQAETALDTDGLLAGSLRRAGRVVLGMDYDPAPGPANPDPSALDEAVRKQALTGFRPAADGGLAALEAWLAPHQRPAAAVLYPPIAEVARQVDAIGPLLTRDPLDGQINAVPLVLKYGDLYFPSFALLLATQTLRINARHLQTDSDLGVKIGGEAFRTDVAQYVYPYFYRARDGKPPFRVYSFADVYAKKVSSREFRGKTVLIGATAPRLTQAFNTPLGQPMVPVMVMAHTVSSLLNGDLYVVPPWTLGVQILAFLGLALYLTLVLPRFRLATGVALSAILLGAIINVHFVLMMSDATWLPLMGVALALVVGHAILAGKWYWEQRARRFQTELSEANRQLGLSFQAQGQLDHAYDRFLKCLPSGALSEAMYNLGLDFERKRQFNKAGAVFRHISAYDERFRDAKERIARNQEMEHMFVLGKGGANTSAGTLIISKNGVQKPMLGRYQIERELGRGAMGLVYLGRDPKIGRTVAIKTMALSQEFESDQLEDVKKRFFREAETAGRLNHPNIVTIYDVGDDHDLAYIAMDYLKGENLLTYCKPEHLLPVNTVFDIIVQVAEALDYAHNNNVVHRDIKPANIIYDEATGTVKVTDFGVAHLTDASRTRTGTILGSPSYMSPEQLAGKRVDGRSDLFSLGITLYQLLTGELPFIGESLASLMYKIANEKHPDVRMFRPDLPPCVAKVVNKALSKEIEKRFQSGVQMASGLRRCQESLGKS